MSVRPGRQRTPAALESPPWDQAGRRTGGLLAAAPTVGAAEGKNEAFQRKILEAMEKAGFGKKQES
jgi:hypothetical protein